jgi:hypothetical protein
MTGAGGSSVGAFLFVHATVTNVAASNIPIARPLDITAS